MQFSWTEAFALVALFTFIALSWRYERSCLARHLAQTGFARSLKDKHVADDPEARGRRAMALMLATVCYRGDDGPDAEQLLGLADEFLQYIEGNNAVMPRPDKVIKGRIPRR